MCEVSGKAVADEESGLSRATEGGTYVRHIDWKTDLAIERCAILTSALKVVGGEMLFACGGADGPPCVIAILLLILGRDIALRTIDSIQYSAP